MALKVIPIPAQTEPAIGNVVVLHGWGANAPDAASFASAMQLTNINLFLPEGPFQHPYSTEGRMWYGLPDPIDAFSFADDISTKPELQTSRQQLMAFIQSLPEQTGIPLARTILGGFSQGGAMTIDVGLDLPLAGLMSLSGYLHKSLADVTSQTPQMLMVHGKQDMVVPFQASQRAQAALLPTGIAIDYHAFEPMGHEISWDVITYMKAFVQQQLIAP